MLVTGYWAEPPLDRERTRVFFPTLDSMIGDDEQVRLVDEVLASVDWSAWEAEYNGHRGQPPIHPRYIAGAILYGVSSSDSAGGSRGGLSSTSSTSKMRWAFRTVCIARCRAANTPTLLHSSRSHVATSSSAVMVSSGGVPSQFSSRAKRGWGIPRYSATMV